MDFLNGLSDEYYGEEDNVLTGSKSVFRNIKGVRIVSPKVNQVNKQSHLNLHFCEYAKMEKIVIDNIQCEVDLNYGSAKENLNVLGIINGYVSSIQNVLLLNDNAPWKNLTRLVLSGCGITKIPKLFVC